MAAWQPTKAAKQPVPDREERARAIRGDAPPARVQRSSVPASLGGRNGPGGLTPQAILMLQRTAGNRAVNALLRGQAGGIGVLQRCGAVPCGCSPEEKAARSAAPPSHREESRMLQREPSAQAARIDVAIVLTDDELDMAEGHTYAGTVLRVTSPEDARDQLKALGKPIGTLYVVSHSNAAGQVEFTSSIGTLHWTPISDLGKTLKQGFAAGREPVSVDFRGCKVGSAGQELESFRSGVGAQSAKGSTCWTFSDRVTPLNWDGVEIKSPSDIPSRYGKGGKEIKSRDEIPKRTQWHLDRGLLDQLDGLKSEDGHPVKDCLLGLAPGEAANRANLKKIWDLYWANSGILVATWASPQFNHNWQKGSICTKDMTASTTPCGLVEKTAPPASGTTPPAGSGASAPAGGGRQSMLDTADPDQHLAGIDIGRAADEEIA